MTISNQNLIPFNFQNCDIRLIEIEGEPWFIAKDVAHILGYKRTADAIRTHCKGVGEIQTPIKGVLQTVKIIPERDVYRLIMKSKLPAAEAFEDWVVGEVLPSIRKTGNYGSPTIDFSNSQQVASLLAQSLGKVQSLQAMNDNLIEKIEHDQPDVEFAQQIKTSDESISVGEAAKILGTGRSRLFAILRQHGWITRRNEPYQTKITSGYLDVKLTPWQHPEQGFRESITTLITGKGLAKLQKLLAQKAA